MPANLTAPINGNPIPLKSSLSWYQRGLSTNCARTSVEKRTTPQKIGATTIGQSLGFAVALAGLVDLAYKVFYSDSDSFWNKYITPLIITSFGLSAVGASTPPRNVLGIDILASGINNVISHFKSLENGSSTRFTKEVVKKIGNSLNGIVEDLQFFMNKVAYRAANDHLEGMQSDISEHFSPDETLKKQYGGLYQNLNSALDTIGFQLVHEFDRGRVQLFIKSKNVFSSSHDDTASYEPFLMFSMGPKNFALLLDSLKGIFDTSYISTDKEIVQELITTLLGLELPSIQGYTVTSNGSVTRRYLRENIRPYISRENLSIIDTFLNSITVKQNGIDLAVDAESEEDAPRAIIPFPGP